MTTTEEDTSYIDYETFLSPTFSPSQFANSLVLSTNNSSDTPLDLSTPLSRVLFDNQEINTHIDTLTTKSALPLLSHTQEQTESSQRIVQEIDEQVKSLNDGYKRLEKEVLVRYETAEEVRAVAGRLWETVRLGRSVGRALQLGRTLEVQLAEAGGTGNVIKSQTAQKEDHRALVRCSNTLLSLRELFSKNGPGEEGAGLEKVDVVRTLQTSIVAPAERSVLSKSQQIVREFSMSSLSSGNTTTYAQTADTKARTTSALLSLYLLSSVPAASTKKEKWEPELLVGALQDYLRTALTSSLASLAKSLATLPNLDRTLLEVSARCQNILALESLIQSITPPPHPLLSSSIPPPKNFLDPLLQSLETGSLASYFWRTLAGGLSMKVTEIVNKGGVSARTLKSNRKSVGDAVRECVVRGCQPLQGTKGGKGDAAWEREAAVMVGSVVNPLGR
jgi:hypothetical protein